MTEKKEERRKADESNTHFNDKAVKEDRVQYSIHCVCARCVPRHVCASAQVLYCMCHAADL